MDLLGHQLIFHVEILEIQEGSNMNGFISCLSVILVFSLRQTQMETMTLRSLKRVSGGHRGKGNLKGIYSQRHYHIQRGLTNSVDEAIENNFIDFMPTK